MLNFSINNLRSNSRLLLKTLLDDNGQDLVEYAAVIVLVVLALTGGMQTLAQGINDAMTSVGTYINSVIG
jgi:pilus assembly protein Flp/PilA